MRTQRQRAPKPRYDIERIVGDMTIRGWNNTKLAERCEPKCSGATIGRFLTGAVQTARVATAIAKALGHQTPQPYIKSVTR